ncbi:MAG: hypothetical protein CL908_19990 [Deltaproteobacteria bacterium]|jgi:hypothetical protein|nr:hypothetical protein [Deltaproteobacteria bacterium]
MIVHILLIVGGLFAGFLGYQELGLAQQASALPQPIELVDLESGQAPPNIHVQLGHHWKVWDELIYSYRTEKEDEEVGPATRIDYSYFPIISEEHPYSQAFNRLAERYESLDQVPEAEWPRLKDFAVLVRSEAFSVVGKLPGDEGWGEAEQMVGLIVNDIHRLKSDEKSLLSQSYPSLDLDKVLILEEGRQVESLAYCLGIMTLGAGLVITGGVLIFRSTTGRVEGVGELPPLLKKAEVF